MIAFEVRVNGKRVCVAGAEDLMVLTAGVTASGMLGQKAVPLRPDGSPVEVHYHVGGLTSRADPSQDVHLTWRRVEPLRVGDVVEISVVETDTADRPRLRKRAKREPGRRRG